MNTGSQYPISADEDCVEVSLTPPTLPCTVEPELASLPKGSIARQVFILSLPMLGEQVVNFAVGFVDTFLAGDISKEATAAVGTASYFSWIIMLFFTLVGTGAVALVARSTGAGDKKATNLIANQALMMSVIIGFVASSMAYLLAPWVAAHLTQTSQATEICSIYLRIDAMGYAASSIAMICFGVFRATGDTRTPMYIMFVLNAVNVLVSVGLVRGWVFEPMGVRGIAYGTLAARVFSGFLVLFVMFWRPRGFRIIPKLLLPDWKSVWRITRIGIPTSIEMGLMGAAHMMFVWIISKTASGDAATTNTAAHMIGIKMEAIGYLPAVAWATAAATMAGQYLGADRPAQAKKSGLIAIYQITIITAVIGSTFVMFSPAIYAMMTNDAAVQAVGAPAFRIMGFAQPVLATAIVMSNILRCVGDTRTNMVFAMICGLGLRLPLAYLFGVVLGGGLLGAWCGMWCDNIARCALGLWRFLRGKWMHIKV